MAWDPSLFFSKDNYRYIVQSLASETMQGLHNFSALRSYQPLWWINREIRIFWEPTISQDTVETIITAIADRTKEVGLPPFTFVRLGSHASSANQVAMSLIQGQLDAGRLFTEASIEDWRDEHRGGRQHGDVYITSQTFLDDAISWGAADFRYGAMIFTLYGNRQQDLPFLRNVALHETSHLLGMRTHCNDYLNVEGFSYSRMCNMHGSCPTATLCPKCLSLLKNWWAQIEYEYYF